jgi:hypothetical protein
MSKRRGMNNRLGDTATRGRGEEPALRTGRCCPSRTSGTDPKAWRGRGDTATRRGKA